LSLQIHDGDFTILVAISITAPPEGDKKCDLKTYLEGARRNHEAEARTVNVQQPG
jgi:hypothetical protein